MIGNVHFSTNPSITLILNLLTGFLRSKLYCIGLIAFWRYKLRVSWWGDIGFQVGGVRLRDKFLFPSEGVPRMTEVLLQITLALQPQVLSTEA